MKNKDYIKMLKYFKKVRVYLLIICLLSLLICGVDVVIPIITTKIITNITNLYIDKTIILTIILFSVSILSIIINKISNIVYLKKIHQQIIINIRTDLINKILNLKIVNFDKHTSGEFIERLRNDPENISEILSIMQYSIFSLITNIIIFIYVFYLNFIIGIIFLTCVVITYFYEKYAFKKYEIKSISKIYKI